MKVLVQNSSPSSAPSIREGGALFSSREWLVSYVQDLHHFALLNKNEEPIGRFSYFQGNKGPISYLITAPFAQHIGLHFEQKGEKNPSRYAEEKHVHSAIAEHLIEQGAQIIELVLPPGQEETQVYQWKDFDIRPRYTYHLDLSLGDEELLRAMSPERRKNIRKAQKAGLRCERISDPEAFLQFMSSSRGQKGLEYDASILKGLLQSSELEPWRDLWVSYREDLPISCALVMRDMECAYYLVGGYERSENVEGAQSLLLWEAMGHAREKQCKTFDLEGSMIPEIERFFRGFGGDRKTYFEIRRRSSLGTLAQFLKNKMG